MVKTYVLDTSVLVSDPDAMFKFKENNIIIPITVIEELDNLKGKDNDAARAARMASRKIKELTVKHGQINEYVPCNEDGGHLKVTIKIYEVINNLPLDFNDKYSGMDNRIINTAFINKGILVTKDNNLMIVAKAYGVEAQDYENEKVDIGGLYTGINNGSCSEDQLDAIYKDGYIKWTEEGFFPNECVILRSYDNPKHSALARYDSKNQILVNIPQVQKIYEIQPKNTEQQFLMDLLFNPDIKLLTVTGVPGSGKTLLAIIAGLYQAMEHHTYKKVIVSRSPMAIENDMKLGFLPGSLYEKLAPWMGAMYDNIDYVMGKIKTADIKQGKKTRGKNKDLDDPKDIGLTNGVNELMEHGYLELLSLEHIRGRSLANSFLIIDEAQNLSHHAVKTILTRISESSKVILLGDIRQVDSTYLDSNSNGLVYCIEKFKEQEIAAQINLVKSERSKLAELADKLL